MRLRHILRYGFAGWAVLLWAAGFYLASAQVASPTSTPEATPLPKECSECHLDIVQSWQESSHAWAYQDTDFQAAWASSGQAVQCLACHTTGFVPATGVYEHEGVTCAACHGVTPAEHPPAALTVDAGVRVCTDCHPTTYAEWQRSAHGSQQLACTTCHNPHPQSLRFADSTALCLNCHDEPLTDYAHTAHPEQQCVECHWHKGKLDPQHALTGNLMPTGHDAVVETRTCLDCHAETAVNTAGVSSAATGQRPFLAAQIRIQELEAQLQTQRVEQQNAVLSLAGQALIVGMGISALALIAGLTLYRRWTRKG